MSTVSSPVEDAPRDGDAGPVEIPVVKDGRTREQGHASSRRVTRHAGHWMFHACHR
jgi:hypothetical protein